MARSLRATFSRSYFFRARSSLIFLVLALPSRFFVSSEGFEDYDPEPEPDEEDPEDEELDPDEEEKHEGEED